MGVRRLVAKRVPTLWGRRDLPTEFGGEQPQPVGEICFEDVEEGDSELLVKFLFTSEKLSVQVHPDDEAARRAGYPRGKDEAWIVLTAQPDAVIGVGLRAPTPRNVLRNAALKGSIDTLLDWHPVQAGEIYYAPAGNLHAIGGGLTLLEIQQNTDVTYRLYDYARPRNLHLDAALAVVRLEPFPQRSTSRRRAEGGEILLEGVAFVVERRAGPAYGQLFATLEREVWLVPLRNRTLVDGLHLVPGNAAIANTHVPLALERGAEVILAYPGGEPLDPLVG